MSRAIRSFQSGNKWGERVKFYVYLVGSGLAGYYVAGPALTRFIEVREVRGRSMAPVLNPYPKDEQLHMNDLNKEYEAFFYDFKNQIKYETWLARLKKQEDPNKHTLDDALLAASPPVEGVEVQNGENAKATNTSPSPHVTPAPPSCGCGVVHVGPHKPDHTTPPPEESSGIWASPDEGILTRWSRSFWFLRNDRVFVNRTMCHNLDKTDFKEYRGHLFMLVNPRNEREVVLKRLMGLPGECIITQRRGLVIIPVGHCWVEGDNHIWAEDSEIWGPIPLACLRGHVGWRVWPLNTFGKIEPRPMAHRIIDELDEFEIASSHHPPSTKEF